MCRALFAIFVTAGIISASAFGSTAVHPATTDLTPEKVTTLKVQPALERVNITTSYRSPSAPALTIGPADKAESGWRYPGTLLATLALIIVIAVRRHKSGKH